MRYISAALSLIIPFCVSAQGVGNSASPWASTKTESSAVSPYKGSASLGYGPVYNFDADAKYRLVGRQDLKLDGFMQFAGMRYTSDYPGIDYDGKVSFRRNTAFAGLKSQWNTAGGTFDASLSYQYSGYNFPILDLPTLATDKYNIEANVMNLNAGWNRKSGEWDYRIGADYSMIFLGNDGANNNVVSLSAEAGYHASSVSRWFLDAGYLIDRSTIVGNKGVLRMSPGYAYSSDSFRLKIGAEFEVATGNCFNRPSALISPAIDISWKISKGVTLWGKANGKIDANTRISLYEEQPYLLADFDAGFSKIYNTEAGMGFGPFRGFRFGFFGGFTKTDDWYIPALKTGYMSTSDVKGWHGGITLGYDYRKYLSINVRSEMAEREDGDYTCGYAPWRDHARLNLVANALVRPISQLEISLGYHLRTDRQKQLPKGNLDLRTISNLMAGITYHIDSRWSVFLRGDNLLDKQWYKGPAVPCQGIKGMLGASCKF